MSFNSDKQELKVVLGDIKSGKIQLPDFQRGWVWDDRHICDLLASISLAYPIGTVMMLQTGNSDVRFKPRLVEGVNLNNRLEPDKLILDGQQRLTSLFQAICSEQPVLTRNERGQEIRRWYYINIAKALDPNTDRQEAIVSLPEDKIVRSYRRNPASDYSTPEKEYEAGLFPLVQIFDSSNWRGGHNEFWNYDRGKIKLFDEFEKKVIDGFKQYQIPLIILRKETPKEAICQVFEKVNTGGVSLTFFELLTATYAAEEFNLRKDWMERETRLKQYNLLTKVANTDFLQAVTLLATRDRHVQALENGTQSDKAPAISCKRKDILKLMLEDYQKWAEPVSKGFQKAAQLLYDRKIFGDRDLPYGTQLTSLAAIFAGLGDLADRVGVKDKLVRWYWCGVFGELYGSAIESRLAKDLPEVLNWIKGGSEPDTISSANFFPDRLERLNTRNSAAYKGLYALLMVDGCLDFRTGDTIEKQKYFDEKIDIHHIFPKEWCRSQGLDDKLYNSIINKTPISARTNRIIGKKAPSQYLVDLQNEASISEERMDEILQSHLVDPAALRSDDFDTFFQSRKEALLTRIEKAMGKLIPREVGEEDLDLADYKEEIEN